MNLSNEKNLHFSFANCVLIYVCLTGMCLVLHDRMVDTPAYEARVSLHQEVMQNTAPAPIQYRIMVYYTAELLQRLGIPFKASYLIIRGMATFASAVLFHLFLSTYFTKTVTLLGTSLLIASFPFTYINYFMQEMDPINLAFFIGGYIIIRARRDNWLYPLLAIAMTNRETPVLLPLVWLLYRWDEMALPELILKFSLFNIVTIGIYTGLRLFFGMHPNYSEELLLSLNLHDPRTWIYTVLITGPFIVPTIQNWSHMPKFLRRAILFTPFFVLFHLVFTILQETRLLLPILPLLIAGTFSAWYGIPETALQTEKSNYSQPKWLPKPKVLYAILSIIFFAFMLIFNSYYEKAHLKSMRAINLANESIRLGNEKYQQGEFKDAIAQWLSAVRYDPDNFELHYNIAVVSIQNLHDPLLAKIHAKACQNIKPTDPRVENIIRLLGLVKQ